MDREGFTQTLRDENILLLWSRHAFATPGPRRMRQEKPVSLLKFVVTSKRCCALLNEFKDWPNIPVDQYPVPTRVEESKNISEDEYLATLTSSV